MRLINPNSSGRFVVRYDHYKPASFTTRAMPVETFRRLIWMNDRLDVPGSRGRDRSTPRWLPLNGLSLLHAALLFPSLSPLSSSPFSFSSTVPFRRANVADSRPREIASRTVVFHCLIRGGAQEDDRRRRLVAKLDDETLFSLFDFQLDSRTRGNGIEAGNSMEGRFVWSVWGGERVYLDELDVSYYRVEGIYRFFLNLLSICKTQNKVNFL